MLFNLLIVIIFVTNVFGFKIQSKVPRNVNIPLDMKIGLYYGTSTGNTENVASIIHGLSDKIEFFAEIDDFENVEQYDGFIFGAPTWHTDADFKRSGTSWDSWLYDDITSYDFKGKPIALFGVGDASSYSSNFCDAMGELYDCFLAAGAKFYGATSTDVIKFDDSKAIRDGKFVGMVFDEDNEHELSEGRAQNWIATLKSEGFPV